MTASLAPSILTADFSQLGEQIKETVATGVQYIHVDVMDGHFVPNLTMGPVVAHSINSVINSHNVIMDVHLMVENPITLIPDFVRAGAKIISVHIEVATHLHRTITFIKEFGIRAGVALNPSTPISTLSEILPYIDLVLIMSVNPGFGGQSYIKSSTQKIRNLFNLIRSRQLEANIEIEVDGGINPSNIREVVAAGAKLLVVGSAIYNQDASITNNIGNLQALIKPI